MNRKICISKKKSKSIAKIKAKTTTTSDPSSFDKQCSKPIAENWSTGCKKQKIDHANGSQTTSGNQISTSAKSKVTGDTQMCDSLVEINESGVNRTKDMHPNKTTHEVTKTSTNSLDNVLKQIKNDYHLCKSNKSENNVKLDKQYCCGACCRKFTTICNLHDHLQASHRAGGSYHYDHFLRTAFPKYDTFCRFTQTEKDVQKENKENAECQKQTHDPVTAELSRDNTSYCDQVKSIHIFGAVEQVIHSDSAQTVEKKECNENNKTLINNKLNGSEASDDNHSDGADNLIDDDGDEENTPECDAIKQLEGENRDEKIHTTSFKKETTVQKRKQSIPKSIKRVISKPSNKPVIQNNEAISAENKPMVDPLPDTNCSCDICGAKFSFKRGLLRHEQMKHLNEMTHYCQYCDQRFMREYNLHKHVKCAHKAKHRLNIKENSAAKRKNDENNCETKLGTYNPGNNSEKNKTVVNEEDTNVIKLKDADTDMTEPDTKKACKKKEDKSMMLKTPHTCDICGYTMPRSKMEVHQRLHSGERPYVCHLCGKGLISQSKLKRHMLIHSEVKKYTCDTCGAGFQMKYKLRMHQHIHTGKKPYLCSICGAEFNHSSNLATHTRCVHLQIKPFECSTCGHKYAKRSQLDDHMLSHSAQKQFVCRYCGKSFKYHKGMHRHEKSHNEEQQFPCDQCECTFSRKDNLERHKHIHKEASLECKMCKKLFKNEKLLQEHEYYHLGRKRFLCVVCGESYRLANQYYTHMLAAHGIERDKAKLMHEEEIQNRSSIIQSAYQDPTVQVDPNLPLRLDEEPHDREAMKTSNTSHNSGSHIVTGMLDDNRAAINALTRVATENLRLHSEDINEEEKLNVIVPPVNPMILLERNQGFTSLSGAASLNGTSESNGSEASIVMITPGSQSRTNMQLSQSNQISNQIPHHSINPPISGQHDNSTRLSQEGRTNFNSLQLPFSQDNSNLTAGSVNSVYSVQDARLTLENLARQHDSVSVPLTLIRLSENIMDPPGQRPAGTEAQEQTNRQTLSYRIQNMY